MHGSVFLRALRAGVISSRKCSPLLLGGARSVACPTHLVPLDIWCALPLRRLGRGRAGRRRRADVVTIPPHVSSIRLVLPCPTQ